MTQSGGQQDPLIGRRLGAYRIQKLKGEGGFAAVYLAVHESLGRPVAVKVLWPHLARNPDFVGRFLREARAVAALRHPNIVQVYDVGQEGEYYYIIMDYIEGTSLLDLLRSKKRVDLTTALSIVEQIGAALDYAHDKGVVHRDVKPSNILLDGSGKAYLSDFGIAKAAWTSQLTRTGISIGTPEYMSPEQAEGREVDHRSDLYSLGIVLYEMLCGSPPFSAETPLAVVYKQVKETPPPFSTWKVKVPKGVEDVVMKAVAKDPSQRFQSGAEMASALERAVRGVPAIPKAEVAERVSPPPRVATPKPKKVAPRWRLAGAAVLGVAVLATGLLLAMGPSISTHNPTPTPTPTARLISTRAPAAIATSTHTGTPTATSTSPTQVPAVPEASQTATLTPTKTWSPVPTNTRVAPSATNTPLPPQPTNTQVSPSATNTPPPQPTNTPPPAPTDTPEPTRTPRPLPTVVPPTDTPEPTRTPRPLPTVAPTDTPEPPPSGSALRLPPFPPADAVSMSLLATAIAGVVLGCRPRRM